MGINLKIREIVVKMIDLKIFFLHSKRRINININVMSILTVNYEQWKR